MKRRSWLYAAGVAVLCSVQGLAAQEKPIVILNICLTILVPFEHPTYCEGHGLTSMKEGIFISHIGEEKHIAGRIKELLHAVFGSGVICGLVGEENAN